MPKPEIQTPDTGETKKSSVRVGKWQVIVHWTERFHLKLIPERSKKINRIDIAWLFLVVSISFPFDPTVLLKKTEETIEKKNDEKQ